MADRLKVSVVIAAYNEAQTIEAVVERVRAVPLDFEIIAVDDGSSDGTGAVIDRLQVGGAAGRGAAPSGESRQGRGAPDRDRPAPPAT